MRPGWRADIERLTPDAYVAQGQTVRVWPGATPGSKQWSTLTVAHNVARPSMEVHIYSAGGHGFGMPQKGRTSDHWADELYFWLEALQLTVPTP